MLNFLARRKHRVSGVKKGTLISPPKGRFFRIFQSPWKTWRLQELYYCSRNALLAKG